MPKNMGTVTMEEKNLNLHLTKKADSFSKLCECLCFVITEKFLVYVSDVSRAQPSSKDHILLLKMTLYIPLIPLEGKAVPLQAWSVPEGTRKVAFTPRKCY